MLGRRVIANVPRWYPALAATSRMPALRPLQQYRFKWLSAEEAKTIPNVHVGGSKARHPDDPELNTWNVEYHGHPEKGDPYTPSYTYREYYNHQPYADRLSITILTSFFWFWVIYHLYFNHGMLIGHYYMPYMDEFTDEELGIPPDDAPDPDYWGHQGKPYGSYR